MPRFFFDVHDGVLVRDDEGTELPDLEAVRKQVMCTLPSIAADEIPKDGDRQTFLVLVSEAYGHPVYSATLTYTGMWLLRP